MEVYWYNDEYIKRKDAIDAITYVGFDKPTDIVPLTLYIAQKKIRDIPAANVVPKSEWISVKDRLPEKNSKVLVYIPKYKGLYDGMHIAYYSHSLNMWVDLDRTYLFDHPTYWMPLPVPPTEKEN